MSSQNSEDVSVARGSFLLAPGLVAFLLCFIGIGKRQFWGDEHATWWITRLSTADFEALLLKVDAVMAPYYYVERLVVWLGGDSPLVMRLPSAFMIGISATLVTAICVRLIEVAGNEEERRRRHSIGVTAGLAFATIPSVSYYGQEARVYGCAIAATLACTLLLLRAREKPSLLRWVAYGLGLISIGLTHVVGLCILATHATLMLLAPVEAAHERAPGKARSHRGCWAITVGVSLLLLSPFLWWCSGQTAQISWIRAGWRDLWNLEESLFHQRLVGRFFLLTAFGTLFSCRGRPSLARLTLLVWAFLPPALLFATREQFHLFLHRYLLFTLPAFSLLGTLFVFDLGSRFTHRSSRPWLVPAVVFALLAAVGTPTQLRLREVRSAYRTDYSSASRHVLQEQRPGDGIAFGATHKLTQARTAFTYFARHTKEVPRDLFVDLNQGHPEDYRREACPQTLTCLPPELHRIWLITTARPGDLLSGLPHDRAKIFQERFATTGVWSFKDVTVALLTRISSAAAAAN